MKLLPLSASLRRRFENISRDARKVLAAMLARLPALAPAERIALAFIAIVLASGAALRAWERSGVTIGPVEDWETLRAMVLRSREDLAGQGETQGGYPCAVEDRPGRLAADRAAREAGENAPGEILAAGVAGAKPDKPRAEGGKKPPPKRPIDPNTAGEKALLALPGVGPSTAKAIIAHRETRGKFRSIEDLLQVKGIGPKKLDAMRPHLRVSAPGDSTAAHRAPD